MLVLSRKKDESIILQSPEMKDIKITVVEIDSKNRVKIGIEADQIISVVRQEIQKKGFLKGN